MREKIKIWFAEKKQNWKYRIWALKLKLHRLIDRIHNWCRDKLIEYLEKIQNWSHTR